MKILFVEDDGDDVLLLEHACKKAGIAEEKLFFRNGRMAIDYLAPPNDSGDNPALSDPFLLFVDLNMPEMNGFEFLEWLRDHEAFRTAPVIVLSTSESARDICRAYELGANAYLIKPNSISELANMLSAARAFWVGYNSFARPC